MDVKEIVFGHIGDVYKRQILYALFIRRLSNKALTVFVVLLGVALAAFAVFNVSTYGNIGVGLSLIHILKAQFLLP